MTIATDNTIPLVILLFMFLAFAVVLFVELRAERRAHSIDVAHHMRLFDACLSMQALIKCGDAHFDSGYCMCGGKINPNSNCGHDGHSQVDSGEYYSGPTLHKFDKAVAASSTVLGMDGRNGG